MRSSFATKSLVAVVTCLAIAGCENMNSGAAAGIGAGIGGLIGNEIGGTRGALIGAAGGALAGYAFAESYKASQAQQREAEQRAAYYASKPASSNKIKRSKAKYVAVPVKSKKSKGNDVVLVNKETGKAESEAYVPKTGESFDSGEVVTVGGKEAVVGSSFQGI